MPLFAVAFASTSVQDGSVLNGVETPVQVSCDGSEYSFNTKANVVSRALEATPCSLNTNDISDPTPDTKLDGSLIKINVIKATPVTIVEDGKMRFEKSAYKNVSDILSQLKIKVYPEDSVSSELIISDFQKNGLGQKITIKRSPAIIFEADGNIFQMRTNKTTVGEVLTEKGITLGPKDEVTPGLSANIVSGSKITVTRVTEADVQEDVVMPFETVTRSDNNLYQGQTNVEAEGANGLKKTTSRVINRNGVLASKTTLSETVVQAPKNKVVVTGAKPYGRPDLWATMVAAGAQWGVDPGQIYRVGLCESGLTPSRVGMAYGLMQYKMGTWNNATRLYPGGRFAGASVFDPTAQIYVTAWKVRSNGWREWACKP